jgi:hypothetical protein
VNDWQDPDQAAALGDEVDYGRVLSRYKADVADAARAVAHAVYAEVPMVDRLRASEGVVLSIVVQGAPSVHGTLVETGRDAVLLAAPVSGAQTLVPLHRVLAVAGAGSGHRAPGTALERRRGLAGMLRTWLDQELVVDLPAGPVHGVLERVGADHLQLATGGGPLIVPFAGIVVVRPAPQRLIGPGGSNEEGASG